VRLGEPASIDGGQQPVPDNAFDGIKACVVDFRREVTLDFH
jgi:hypothetical protein